MGLSQMSSPEADLPRPALGPMMVALVFADHPLATPQEVGPQEPSAVSVEDVCIEEGFGQPRAVKHHPAQRLHPRRAARSDQGQSFREATCAASPSTHGNGAPQLVERQAAPQEEVTDDDEVIEQQVRAEIGPGIRGRDHGQPGDCDDPPRLEPAVSDDSCASRDGECRGSHQVDGGPRLPRAGHRPAQQVCRALVRQREGLAGGRSHGTCSGQHCDGWVDGPHATGRPMERGVTQLASRHSEFACLRDREGAGRQRRRERRSRARHTAMVSAGALWRGGLSTGAAAWGREVSPAVASRPGWRPHLTPRGGRGGRRHAEADGARL